MVRSRLRIIYTCSQCRSCPIVCLSSRWASSTEQMYSLKLSKQAGRYNMDFDPRQPTCNIFHLCLIRFISSIDSLCLTQMPLALNTRQLLSQTVFFKSGWSLPGMERFTISLQTNHPQFSSYVIMDLSTQSWMCGFVTRVISHVVLQDSLSLFVFHLFWGAFSLPLALCRRWWPFFSYCTGMGHWRLWGKGSALDRYRPCQGHISSLISANFGWAFQLCLISFLVLRVWSPITLSEVSMSICAAA